MRSLNIRIPDKLACRLMYLAQQTGRTKSYYVRQALEEKLLELEDYYLALQSLIILVLRVGNRKNVYKNNIDHITQTSQLVHSHCEQSEAIHNLLWHLFISATD